jgi:uncharacterized protein YbdZ (MbtH family)
VATVPFRLGRPEDLPTTYGGVRDTVDHGLGDLLDGLDRSAGGDLAALLAQAHAARGDLGDVPGEPFADDPDESAANRDNDLAFGIVRTRGPAIRLLVDAALAAQIGILELALDGGTGLDPESWQRLIGGFDALFGWLAEPSRPPQPRPVPLPAPPGPARREDALRRWVRGHHVFMVFAQTSAVAIACLTDSARRRDLPGAEASAVAAAALMRGCEGALRYAGDASRDHYEEQIRPTLMPPIAPPKMSGLHWRDHEALISGLTGSTDAWAWLGEHRPDLLTGFRAALGESYDCHQGVCEHFVGNQSPSLLAVKGSSRSAVDVLAQFRRIRLRSLPQPPQTPGNRPGYQQRTTGNERLAKLPTFLGDDDGVLCVVVVNGSSQYSIWPQGREIPAGWQATGFSGPRSECLEHIETVWPDPTALPQRSDHPVVSRAE